MKRQVTNYALRNNAGRYFNYNNGRMEDDLAFGRHVLKTREKAEQLQRLYYNPNPKPDSHIGWENALEIVPVTVTLEAE